MFHSVAARRGMVNYMKVCWTSLYQLILECMWRYPKPNMLFSLLLFHLTVLCQRLSEICKLYGPASSFAPATALRLSQHVLIHLCTIPFFNPTRSLSMDGACGLWVCCSSTATGRRIKSRSTKCLHGYWTFRHLYGLPVSWRVLVWRLASLLPLKSSWLDAVFLCCQTFLCLELRDSSPPLTSSAEVTSSVSMVRIESAIVCFKKGHGIRPMRELSGNLAKGMEKWTS